MNMETIQSVVSETLVNLVLAVITLAGTYAIYYIRLGASKLQAQTAQIADEKARQLLDAAAPSNWLYDNQMVLRPETTVDFTISVSGGTDEFGNDIYEDYSFVEGQVPDFVREDLNLDEMERLRQEMDGRPFEE